MARWIHASVLVLGALSFSTLAQAQGSEKGAGNADKSGEVRKDPQGLTGISPYWESINKGDNAYVARDLDGAMTSYKEAVQKEPQNALGHYRMGEVHAKKGELKEAEAAYTAALRYVGSDYPLKAKLLFVLADLSERNQKYDQASKRWTEYGELATSKPESKAYAATATERKKRIETWKKLVEVYSKVKARIAKRLAEANEKSRRNRK